MTTIRKTVTFTHQQDKWIKSQIAAGEFTNDSEYIRHLVRNDQAKNVALLQLKMEIQKGLESGVSDKSVSEIMTIVEDNMRKDGKL
jgi:antitoxin ParD1/3/4